MPCASWPRVIRRSGWRRWRRSCQPGRGDRSRSHRGSKWPIGGRTSQRPAMLWISRRTARWWCNEMSRASCWKCPPVGLRKGPMGLFPFACFWCLFMACVHSRGGVRKAGEFRKRRLAALAFPCRLLERGFGYDGGGGQSGQATGDFHGWKERADGDAEQGNKPKSALFLQSDEIKRTR